VYIRFVRSLTVDDNPRIWLLLFAPLIERDSDVVVGGGGVLLLFC
jgi:hypothetical protein